LDFGAVAHDPALLERTVPRYTSYPTAPHFSAAVDGDSYRSWLTALPREATLSLYLHIPFCTQLCFYCGCHTKAVLRRDPVDAYARRLIEEIALVGRYAGGRKVVHLHWGGGTPSILGADWLRTIATALADTFDLGPVREHAIELDPRYLTPTLARALADIGVDRASFGVQDFNPEVQRAVGRWQPFAIVDRAVSLLADGGLDRINLDLMYGLPKQDVADVEATARHAHALRPRRLAVFGYAHVPWMKPNQRLIEETALPGAQARLMQAETVHRTLLELGYQPIGLDHYARADDELATAARSGRLHRNFQGYTVDAADVLIGLGASAIGRLPNGFVQNAPDIGGYGRAIESGRLATARGIAILASDRLRGRIIERLMCDLMVRIDEIVEADGTAAREDFSDALMELAPLVDQGIVSIDGGRIAMTEKGRPLVRLVASAFDTYLSAGRARHSPAV
jgi:oxygen-independent coproporphyrinogen-3 oxidase